MPSIYSYRHSNIAKTWMMFAVFLIVVIGLGWFFSYYFQSQQILTIAVIFALSMNLIAYWFSDKIVLAMHRARPVTRENGKELYELVENLCRTAGLPLPKIYIVEEQQLNAFATGRNPQHAVIAVTRGLLQKLSRTELEGVIAHELSHIGNRDMLVSTVAVVLAGFIAIFSDMFLRSQLWGRNRDSRSSVGGIIMLIGLIFAIVAPIALTLMRLAISRRRESLADASGALLTHNPNGLADALEKIAIDNTPMHTANNTTAHLWVDDPFNHLVKTPLLHKLFMTHPPIEERIAALRGMK